MLRLQIIFWDWLGSYSFYPEKEGMSSDAAGGGGNQAAASFRVAEDITPRIQKNALISC